MIILVALREGGLLWMALIGEKLQSYRETAPGIPEEEENVRLFQMCRDAAVLTIKRI